MKPRTEWRVDNVFREAVLSVKARPLRTALTMVTLGLLFGALSVVEVQDTTGAIETSRLLRDAGQFVFRAQPTPLLVDPQIDRSQCDGLSRFDQVVAAGGLTEMPRVSFPAAPGTPLRTFAGTGSIVSVLDSSASGGANTIWLSTGARRTIGGGETLRLADGELGRVGVFDPGQRHPSAGLMVIVPSLSPLVNQCWFSTHPGATQATLRAVEAQLSTDSVSVVAGSILAESDVLVDPAADFAARPSRRLWIAAGLFGGLFLTILAITDRGALALYRLLGASRSQAVLIGVVGSVLVTVWSMLVALGAAAFWASDMPPEAIRSALLAVSGAACVMALTGSVGRVLVASGSVGRPLRNRA